MCNYTTDPNLLFSATEFHLTELTSLVKAHDSFYRNIYDFLFFLVSHQEIELKIWAPIIPRVSDLLHEHKRIAREATVGIYHKNCKNLAIGVRLVNDGFFLFFNSVEFINVTASVSMLLAFGALPSLGKYDSVLQFD